MRLFTFLALLGAAAMAADTGAVNKFSVLISEQTTQWQEVPVVNPEAGGNLTSRVDVGACVLGEHMYFFGGKDAQGDTHNELWRFSFVDLTWTMVTPVGSVVPSPRRKLWLVCDEGRQSVYALGAKKPTDNFVYRETLNMWEEFASQATGDVNSLSAIQGSDYVPMNTPRYIVCAGTKDGESNKFLMYDKDADVWLAGDEPHVGVEDPGGFAFGDTAYMVGGSIPKGASLPDATFKLNTSKTPFEWERVKDANGLAGEEHAAVYSPGTDVAICLGDPSGKGSLAAGNGVALFSLAEQKWSVVNIRQSEWMPTTSEMKAVGYKGTMVVFGGTIGVGADGNAIDSNKMWVYNPAVCPWNQCSGRGTCRMGNCEECRDESFGDGCQFEPPPTEPEILIPTVVCAIGAVLLAIGGVYFYIQREARRRAKAVRFAPQSGSMTLIFTDIYKSSVLWGDKPADMAVALALHNEICRSLLDEFEGYEVKTIGDAFMLAFARPEKAVYFSCEFQRRLYDAPWPAGILEHPAACPDVMQRGLRVRIGLHCGPCVVRATPQGGFDYEGPVVNLCARVSDSGCGGQVIMTEHMLQTAESYLDSCECEVDVEYIGEYQFKGISGDVGVVQITRDDMMERKQKFTTLRNCVPVKQEEPTLQLREVTAGAGWQSSASSAVMDSRDKRATVEAMQTLRKYVGRFGPGGIPVARLSEILTGALESVGCLSLMSVLVTQIATLAANPDKTRKNATISRGPKDDSSSKYREMEPRVDNVMALSRRNELCLRWTVVSEIFRQLPSAPLIELSRALRDDLLEASRSVASPRGSQVSSQDHRLLSPTPLRVRPMLQIPVV